MKKPLKKLLPTILFLMVFAALFVAVFYYYFTGQPDAVSIEELNFALVSQNLKPIDVTDSSYGKFPDAGLSHCIVAEQEDIRFEFYHFDNTRSAMGAYRQAHSLIITTRLAYPRTEISYGKAKYQVYTLKADDVYSVAVCVGNTAIYATCNAENETKINRILDCIGYINTVPEQSSPAWLSAVLNLIQFLAYIPVALVGRHQLWRAAYRSAGKTMKQMINSKKTRKELMSWIAEISPRKKTTKTILVLYKLNLLPAYIGVIIAIVSCFTRQIINLLNTTGIAIPGIIFATGIVGITLSRIFTSKKDKYR